MHQEEISVDFHEDIEHQHVIESRHNAQTDEKCCRNREELKRKLSKRSDLTFKQIKLLEKAIEQGLSESDIETIANPEFDIWQMQLVTVGLGYGLTMEEIRPAIEPDETVSFEERNGVIETVHMRKVLHTVVKDEKHSVSGARTKSRKEKIR